MQFGTHLKSESFWETKLFEQCWKSWLPEESWIEWESYFKWGFQLFSYIVIIICYIWFYYFCMISIVTVLSIRFFSLYPPPPILIPVCVPFPSPEPLWDRLCCLKELELNCGNLMSCIECLVKYLVHNNHSITTGWHYCQLCICLFISRIFFPLKQFSIQCKILENTEIYNEKNQ